MDDDDLIIDVSSIGSALTISLPSSANIGDIWLDTNTSVIQTYDINSEWITISDDNNINIGNIDINSLSFPIPEEWKHEFPSFQKVEEMCKEYPALEKAYENFKTIYKMVEQDYIGKKKDDDPPF